MHKLYYVMDYNLGSCRNNHPSITTEIFIWHNLA